MMLKDLACSQTHSDQLIAECAADNIYKIVNIIINRLSFIDPLGEDVAACGWWHYYEVLVLCPRMCDQSLGI